MSPATGYCHICPGSCQPAYQSTSPSAGLGTFSGEGRNSPCGSFSLCYRKLLSLHSVPWIFQMPLLSSTQELLNHMSFSTTSSSRIFSMTSVAMHQNILKQGGVCHHSICILFSIATVTSDLKHSSLSNTSVLF